MGKEGTSRSGALTISLFDPGMTALHRAGLAGLWMTLHALPRDRSRWKRLTSKGTWQTDDVSVTLTWKDKTFFDDLIEASFDIDSNGLLQFAALGNPAQKPQHATVLQEAVLGTVLQHGRTRKADPSAKPEGRLSVQVDDNSIVLRYHKVTEYAHQKPDFTPDAVNKLVGWLYPGAGGRHMGLGKVTHLDNPPGLALVLRYLIVGAIYFEIHRRGGGVRPRYAIVIPEIVSLSGYSKARSVFLEHGVQQLKAAGTAEAGLRVLVSLEANTLIQDLGAAACRVISFGTVPWSSQQKTRVEISDVRVGSLQELRAFKAAQQYFEVRLITPQGRARFWDVPQVPELVAENILAGRPWWFGFAGFVADKDRRKHVFYYERGGLARMVSDKSSFNGGAEQVFVAACHEAWRRRLGQLGRRATGEGISFKDLAAREFERARVAFSRCKNAAAIRAAVTDFWSRGAASLPSLQDGWQEVLSLFDERNWQKAKDLALLSLASYKPIDKKEERALRQIAEETEGGDKNG